MEKKKFIFASYHYGPRNKVNHLAHLSWKRRNASWAQTRISPSTGSVSRGRNASKIPLTQRVISLGE